MTLFASLTFAGSTTAPCSLKDFPAEVAKVWQIADHGDPVTEGLVSVGADALQDVGPGAVVAYEVMKFEEHLAEAHLAMVTWYLLPAKPGLPSGMSPIVVAIKRDGTVITAVDAKTCEEQRAIARAFFRQLPKPLTD